VEVLSANRIFMFSLLNFKISTHHPIISDTKRQEGLQHEIL